MQRPTSSVPRKCILTARACNAALKESRDTIRATRGNHSAQATAARTSALTPSHVTCHTATALTPFSRSSSTMAVCCSRTAASNAVAPLPARRVQDVRTCAQKISRARSADTGQPGQLQAWAARRHCAVPCAQRTMLRHRRWRRSPFRSRRHHAPVEDAQLSRDL